MSAPKETPEFPPLNEKDRSLIVNALMIVGGQFGTTKIEPNGGGMWGSEYNNLCKKLGFPGPGWGNKDDRPACKHGCVPAFLDGPGGRVNQRATHCWMCSEEALREEAQTLRARAESAEQDLQYAHHSAEKHEERAANANRRAAEAEAKIVSQNAELSRLREREFMLAWQLHIEVETDHGEECDCKDHIEESRALIKDFVCPGEHCQKGKKDQRPSTMSVSLRCAQCEDLVIVDSSLLLGRKWVAGADGLAHWGPGMGETPSQDSAVCGSRILPTKETIK